MIAIRSRREIDLLRIADQTVATVLTTLAAKIEPGVMICDLDAEAEALIRDAGGIPSFLGYQGYPASTCISVDEVIIHGIPNERELQDGEICSIDVGVNYKGYYGDAALSVACGELDDGRKRLMRVTERSLANGIDAARAGNYLQDISRAIEDTIKPENLGIVRNFVGHGIGSEMHEEPQIPNYVTRGRGPRLKAGMVVAIEPMVNLGTHKVKVLEDDWTAVTADGKPSAHFEHSIVIQPEGPPEILSVSPCDQWRWGEMAGAVARGVPA
ncbi:MAG TPA: type I methionyl aminopeptidase [Candidatus Hydrogenedentes bacterium]|jgi:methionyl aminopeptidase|nr:type I methionyl aminopeptidase [Candidatus Hydrogenedentota bacterium]